MLFPVKEAMLFLDIGYELEIAFSQCGEEAPYGRNQPEANSGREEGVNRPIP
jgi:hypothetical protein